MRRRRYRARALTFRFFHVAEGEMRAARAVARAAAVEDHRFVRLPDMREASDMRMAFGSLPPTYIPMRNSVFYAFAAAYAEEVGAGYIVGGHNADDAKVFKDACDGFFTPLQRAFRAGSEVLERNRLTLLRPLCSMTKPDVVRLAVRLRVPLESTWSCHRQGKRHCWRCAGCEGRREAFRMAGVPDPLVVATSPGKIS